MSKNNLFKSKDPRRVENHVKFNHKVHYNVWPLRGKEVKYSKMSNVSMNMAFTWAVKGIIHPKIESPIQIQDKSLFFTTILLDDFRRLGLWCTGHVDWIIGVFGTFLMETIKLLWNLVISIGTQSGISSESERFSADFVSLTNNIFLSLKVTTV